MPRNSESEDFMVGLMEAATSVATEIVNRKPFSLENRDQREASAFLNSPWVVDNIGALWRYQGQHTEPPIKPTYLGYVRNQFNKPQGSNSLLERLSKAQSKLIDS